MSLNHFQAGVFHNKLFDGVVLEKNADLLVFAVAFGLVDRSHSKSGMTNPRAFFKAANGFVA